MNRRHGEGKAWYPSACNESSHGENSTKKIKTYEGMFCDNMFHGFGRCEYTDGTVSNGVWYKDNFVTSRFKMFGTISILLGCAILSLYN